MQEIEVYTLEKRSRTPYLQSKEVLSSGYTLEYGYFGKQTSNDSISLFCVQVI